jgi:hypothetical protein
MSNAIMRERGREAKEARLNAAFTAWLMGGGGDKTWVGFCKYYGLVGVQKTTKEQRVAEIKRANAVADRITAMFDKGAKNGTVTI